MNGLVAVATAMVLGFLHALEVDHMMAVTAFVSRGPTAATAARFGFRWGVGHSLAVIAAGAVLLLTGLRWSARYDRVGEALVGLMLIAVGIWSFRSARNLHFHSPREHGDHVHLHTHHAGGPDHHHHHPTPTGSGSHLHLDTVRGRGMTLVGLVHGLAGTSAAVALVPVTLTDSAAVGIGYLISFGVGVTVAMTLFAGVAAAAVRTAGTRSLVWGRAFSYGIGGLTVLIGIWWIGRAAAG
jgi:hypothetical protein